MTVRDATTDDLAVLEQLWREFQREIPEPDYIDLDLEKEVGGIREVVRDGIALIAEIDGEPVGYALAELKHPRAAFLHDLYVRPSSRRKGVAAALVRDAVTRLRERGAEVIRLEVLAGNAAARTLYERWGFTTEELTLVAHLDALEPRLAPRAEGPTFGSVHVQTDDRTAVDRAVSRYVPRQACPTPVAGWKRIDLFQDVLPPADTAAVRAAGTLGIEAWMEKVKSGDPTA